MTDHQSPESFRGPHAHADVLDGFAPATAAWFRGAFPEPTAAQEGAWRSIASGQHTLVVAPTGSGKTLSAFLSSLDTVANQPTPHERSHRCRVLYVSPLKALAVDVERNLRSPLVGIGQAARRLGLEPPDVRVSIRSGDTPAAERRAFATNPADILITTPESLFLMLTSSVRTALSGVQTVIIDEVHAVAGTKRGAHLALTLERLDALLAAPAQRIGLSATVEPVEEVARFLGGGRPVTVVRPPSTKEWDLQVVVPVEDMSALGDSTPDLSGPAAGEPRRTSIWPHVEERIVDLIAEHRSTLVFANSRRLAERLTARLNEIWADRRDADDGQPSDGGAGESQAAAGHGRTGSQTEHRHSRTPAEVMAQSGASHGAAADLARAHHGSVSKEQRALIEEDLKAGRLPAVVATSSLELGIDMGAIDLVVQVESPPSVASGLQRVGRAGHQVGAVSRGLFFPKYRGDLVQTAVVVERMRAGAIEPLGIPANPLDVLAQQIVAMCALDDWSVDDIEALIHRSAPFATLPRSALDAVLDMLAGRYPSDEFAELRPRLVWDRVTNILTGRRGAQRLAVTSGGTIPDRGLYGVFLAGSEGAGRRVGELDEEMVYESRVGDVFTLGTSTWRIEDITHNRVLVTPAPGQPGRLPFWKGDSIGRPSELGEAIGTFTREVLAMSPQRARERVARSGLDEFAVDNLLTYLTEQRDATGTVPSDRAIVVERFRDELGDWRLAIHSPYGSPIHAPWALCIAARMRERFGVEVQAMHADDGIVLRLPDVEFEEGAGIGAELLELIVISPDEVEELVTTEIGGSALFAARFRECAARALLLPRRRPDQRQALWQQRQRAAQLLQVASRYPSFPIVLETVRECIQDVFDVPGLVHLMQRVGSRDVQAVDVETGTASPFARSLMFGYVAQFLYEGDSPLAERRAAALALDPTLLAELLGRTDGAALRDLLDPEQVARTEVELQRLAPERLCRDAEDVADLLRVLGPLDGLAIAARCRSEVDVDAAVESLVAARRAIRVRIAGEDRVAVIEDAGRLRDALGTSLPVGVPEVFLDLSEDPLGDLLARYARTRTPFGAQDAAAHFGLGVAVVTAGLRRLVAAGRVVEGALRPLGVGGGGRDPDFCDAEILRLLRRRSLAALRSEVEPVSPTDLARFIPAWQSIGGAMRGTSGLLRAIEQLSGAVLPASSLETLVLPSRVAGYSPAMLDELTSSGEVVWAGHGALPGDDGWVSLHLAELAPLTMQPLPAPAPTPDSPSRPAEALGDDPEALRSRVLEVLGLGGAFFFRSLADATSCLHDELLLQTLWDLTWSGQVTNDTLAPLRNLMTGGRTSHKRRSSAPRSTRYRTSAASLGLGRRSSAASRAALPQRSGPSAGAGRWALLPDREPDATTRALGVTQTLLDRYGVLTRGSVVAEDIDGGFAAVYKVLAAAEEQGRVRRGYFVEGCGASQFGTVGAIDRLRAIAKPLDEHSPTAPAVVLAACDPANPYGAALGWPDRAADDADTGSRKGHQPGRKAGALVILLDGRLVLYVERGGRTILSYSMEESDLQAAADALSLAVREGALGRLTVEKSDGDPMLGAHHPLARALMTAGFHPTPRGLRLRR